MSDTEEVIDLHSMKVTELKAELKSRGLPVSGAKAELIERLENYMQEHEGVEVVEEEETEESVENEAASGEKASDDKVEESASNDISVNANESQNNGEIVEEESASSPAPQNSISTAEEETAEKVNMSNVSEKDKKAARANRFAGGNITGNTTDELNKKQSRADRFGITESKSTNKSDKSESLKRRAERFGLSNGSSSTTATVNGSSDQVKKLKSRADRFGNGTIGGGLGNAGSDDKKAARAARFAVK